MHHFTLPQLHIHCSPSTFTCVNQRSLREGILFCTFINEIAFIVSQQVRIQIYTRSHNAEFALHRFM